ncbi:MAG TPA: hypothetical protein VGI39_34495 [Polyangiaceae bacterium]
MKKTTSTLAAALLLTWVLAPAARAAEGGPDVPPPEDEAAKHAIDRTWLYADDARVAAPLTVVAMTNVSYTDTGPSPSRIDSPYPSTYRALAGNTAQPGAMVSAGAEVGLFPRVSIYALGQMGFGSDLAGTNAGAVAGMRFLLTPPGWQHFHLAVSAGYLREAWSGPTYNDDTDTWTPASSHGNNGAWLQAAVSGDLGRARLAGTLHGEHVFADGRDALDVMVTAGASYQIVGPLRAGVEYVGQDLEEIASPGAEGGARHFAGPMVSMQLLRDRLSMVAGPAFGLSDLSPRLLGRLAVAYGF